MKHHKAGSILIFSLMILSLVAVVSERLIRSRLIGSSFAQMMMKKELATLLAMSGLNIAQALVEIDKKPKKDIAKMSLKEKEKEKQESWEQNYLKKILPYLNRWRNFELTEEQDGIDGEIKLCIVAEHGKININEAFDFKKGSFKKEYEFLLKGLEIKGKMPAGQLFTKIGDYLKKRKRKLDDITELSSVDGLEKLGMFYEPPIIPIGEKEKSKSNVDIKLADIFTTWSSGELINPFFLSDGLCSLLMIRRPQHDDPQTMKEAFDSVINSWKTKEEDPWKLLEPIYNEKPKLLKEINRLFSKQFGTPVYSVVSCGKIGDVEQRVIAFLVKEIQKKKNDQDVHETNKNEKVASKQKEQGNDDPQTSGKKEHKSSIESFKVVKIYWL